MQRNQMNQDNDRITSNGGYNNMNNGYGNDSREHEMSSRQNPRYRNEEAHGSDWSGRDYDRGDGRDSYQHSRGYDWNRGGRYDEMSRTGGSNRDLGDYRGSDRSLSNYGDSHRHLSDYGNRGAFEGRGDYGQRTNGNDNDRTHWRDGGYENRGYDGRGYDNRGYEGQSRGYQGRGYESRGYQGRGYQGGNYGPVYENRNYGSYPGSDDRSLDRDCSGYGGSRYDRSGYDREHRGHDDYDRRWTGGGYEEDRRGR